MRGPGLMRDMPMEIAEQLRACSVEWLDDAHFRLTDLQGRVLADRVYWGEQVQRATVGGVRIEAKRPRAFVTKLVRQIRIATTLRVQS
jgi:hypothetical protein